MHISFYQTWTEVDRKFGDIIFLRIIWSTVASYFTLEITVFNFGIQIDIG